VVAVSTFSFPFCRACCNGFFSSGLPECVFFDGLISVFIKRQEAQLPLRFSTGDQIPSLCRRLREGIRFFFPPFLALTAPGTNPKLLGGINGKGASLFPLPYSFVVPQVFLRVSTLPQCLPPLSAGVCASAFSEHVFTIPPILRGLAQVFFVAVPFLFYTLWWLLGWHFRVHPPPARNASFFSFELLFVATLTPAGFRCGPKLVSYFVATHRMPTVFILFFFFFSPNPAFRPPGSSSSRSP